MRLLKVGTSTRRNKAGKTPLKTTISRHLITVCLIVDLVEIVIVDRDSYQDQLIRPLKRSSLTFCIDHIAMKNQSVRNHNERSFN